MTSPATPWRDASGSMSQWSATGREDVEDVEDVEFGGAGKHSEVGGAPARPELAADRELFATLRAVGFTGPEWDLFAVELVRYAVDVLNGWLKNSMLGSVLAKRASAFAPSPEETEHLAVATDFRDGVVDAAVGEALEKFRRKAQANKGWRPDGGASIRTWFITACLFEVINQLKAARRENDRNCRAVSLNELFPNGYDGAQRLELNPGHDGDPAPRIADSDLLRRYLATLSERDRSIVWGKASSLRYREIADQCGEADSRSVERRWQWLKKNYDWIRRLDEEAR